jgi:flagellar protein FliS
MFTPSFSQSFGRPGAMAHAYRRVGVESIVDGASPHRLVELLFDGCMESLAQARGYLRSGQIEAKGRALSRATRIVEEGLKASLNLQEGGRLAQDLNALYGYVALRLTLANVRNDETVLDECVRLLDPLRDAWKTIGSQAHSSLN